MSADGPVTLGVTEAQGRKKCLGKRGASKGGGTVARVEKSTYLLGLVGWTTMGPGGKSVRILVKVGYFPLCDLGALRLGQQEHKQGGRTGKGGAQPCRVELGRKGADAHAQSFAPPL